MKNKNYTASFRFDKSPQEVFNAINDVYGWWSQDFNGSSKDLNDEFDVNFADMHFSKQKLTEVIPDQRVVWLITESNLSFLKNKSEWTGTKIFFDIVKKGSDTELVFTHDGLVPEIECFSDCSKGWDFYLDSLVNLIKTGNGNPNLKEKAKS